ncbi:MAG: helix-turn-helix transcriptional regulator [Ruminococcaceae bacterium]|nr:helix-turn-helix transcriptional regulator [Oscillospiraceae bacterium]
MSDFQRILAEKLKNAEIQIDESPVEVEEYDILKEVRESIVRIRKSKDLSQKDLAIITGISQANISKIENGRYIPSIVILKRIADGLNMRMSIEFLEEEEI